MIKLITDIQLQYLRDVLAGKIKKKDNPRKYSAYERRIHERIDQMVDNLLELAKIRPDILQDLRNELSDEDKPLKRRARTLLKAVSLFENEPTVLSLIAEIYSEHNIEITKKY